MGRVCLLRATDPADEGEQLLAFSFDHSVIDGWALGLLVRAVAGACRSGDHTVRGRGFEAFLHDLPAHRVREESLARWRDLLEPHPLPGLALRLPGGAPRGPESFLADGTFDGALPDRLAADLAAVATRTAG